MNVKLIKVLKKGKYLEDVIKITRENMAEYYSNWKDEFVSIDYLDKNTECIMLKKDNEIIGFIIFEKKTEKNELFVISLQIKKEYQRKGYGTLLIRKLESIAFKNKLKLSLMVLKSNKKAINIYLRNGYCKYGGEGDYLILEKNG